MNANSTIKHEACKICGGKVFKENHLYALLKCEQCEFVFSQIYFSPEELQQVYVDLYTDSGAYANHIKELALLKQGTTVKLGSNRRQILSRLFQRNVKSLVEIGAGVGVIPAYLARKQSNVRYIGYEYNSQIAKQVQALGYDVRTGDHSTLHQQLANSDQDAVVAFEVLEHIEDIAACLQTFDSVLKPNGYLGFTVPNYDRRLNYLTSNEAIYQDCPPIHLNYWMRTSLEHTLQTFGFISLFLRVRSRPYVSWHHPRNMVKNYTRYLLGKYHGPTILCVAQKT